MKADLWLLLDKVAVRGFPKMVRSLDCMHWQWKNCHVGWHGQYTCYKGKLTIILETVASYDTWIWHVFFGFSSSLTVLEFSSLFDDIYEGKETRVKYDICDTQCDQCYYLVDEIYPRCASFVKTIKNLTRLDTQHFTKMHDAYKKDVEKAFEIL